MKNNKTCLRHFIPWSYHCLPNHLPLQVRASEARASQYRSSVEKIELERAGLQKDIVRLESRAEEYERLQGATGDEKMAADERLAKALDDVKVGAGDPITIANFLEMHDNCFID